MSELGTGNLELGTYRQPCLDTIPLTRFLLDNGLRSVAEFFAERLASYFDSFSY